MVNRLVTINVWLISYFPGWLAGQLCPVVHCTTWSSDVPGMSQVT